MRRQLGIATFATFFVLGAGILAWFAWQHAFLALAAKDISGLCVGLLGLASAVITLLIGLWWTLIAWLELASIVQYRYQYRRARKN